MLKPCRSIVLDRLQMIKTEDDKEYRFGKVLLVKTMYLSRKMIAYDADSLKKIESMKYFYDENREYREIDIDSIRFERGTEYSFEFVIRGQDK